MALRTDSYDRFVETAAGLFYSQGITATGVDQIVAQSGLSKPTLYGQFHSKDRLVAAVLARRHEERVESLDAWIRGRAGNPIERLLAVFDWLEEWHKGGGNRGCAFINAAAELIDPAHPAREEIRAHKHWMRDYVAGLAAEAGLSEPQRLGADLMLLVEGANARMLVDGDLTAAADARRVATLLVAAQGKRP